MIIFLKFKHIKILHLTFLAKYIQLLFLILTVEYFINSISTIQLINLIENRDEKKLFFLVYIWILFNRFFDLVGL